MERNIFEARCLVSRDDRIVISQLDECRIAIAIFQNGSANTVALSRQNIIKLRDYLTAVINDANS